MLKKLESLTKLEKRFKKAYFALLKEFDDKQFTLDKARNIINNLGFKNINEVFSELRKNDLLSVSKDSKDFRKSIYQIKSVSDDNKLTKENINIYIKLIAKLTKKSINPNIIIVLFLYKFISDNWHEKTKQNKSEDKIENYNFANKNYLKLYNEKKEVLYTWETAKGLEVQDYLKNILSNINNILKNNKKTFNNIISKFKNIDLIEINDSKKLKILEIIILLLDATNLNQLNKNIKDNIYQILVHEFASFKPSNDEIYTSREVNKLISNLVKVKDKDTVFDPACGSSSLLFDIFTESQKNIKLFGVDKNDNSIVLSSIGAIFHDIKKINFKINDSIYNPEFEQYDYIITHPQCNLRGYGDLKDKTNNNLKNIYNQYIDNGYPLNNSADLGWIQTILYFVKKKAVVVMDKGFCKRSGKEKVLRKQLIRNDLLDCAIRLPKDIFYDKSSGIILIFDKEKPKTRKGKTLFIDLDEYFYKSEKLKILSDEGIKLAKEAYYEYSSINNFSQIVDKQNIMENDYSFLPEIYINKSIETENQNLSDLMNELQSISKSQLKLSQELQKNLEKYLI